MESEFPMHHHPKDAGEPPSTTHDEDDREEVAALRLVLELHPAALTLDVLARDPRLPNQVAENRLAASS